MSSPASLLEEAMALGLGTSTAGRVILIEDCVETSGAFVLHHLMKQALSSDAANNAVLLLALSHPFSHYDRILRKMGCNLSAHKESNRFHFLDMLRMEFPGGSGGNAIEGGLIELYGRIQRAIQWNPSSKKDNHGCVTIMIDDLSLLEIATHGSQDQVLDFLHYCITLTSEKDCSLVVLNHEDIYASWGGPKLVSNLEYCADSVIKAEPLSTGLASDVHGQLTVVNRGSLRRKGSSVKPIHNVHFKVKENGIEYFYPWSRT